MLMDTCVSAVEVDLSCRYVLLLQYICLTMYMRCETDPFVSRATKKCSRSVLPLIRYPRPDYRWYTSKLYSSGGVIIECALRARHGSR